MVVVASDLGYERVLDAGSWLGGAGEMAPSRDLRVGRLPPLRPGQVHRDPARLKSPGLPLSVFAPQRRATCRKPARRLGGVGSHCLDESAEGEARTGWLPRRELLATGDPESAQEGQRHIFAIMTFRAEVGLL